MALTTPNAKPAVGQTPGEVRLDIHGLCLSITADQAWIIELAAPVVGRLNRAPIGCSPHLQIHFRAGETDACRHESLIRCFTHCGTECFYDGDDLRLCDTNCCMTVHGTGALATGIVSLTATSEPQGFERGLWMTIMELLRRTKTYHVHAACVTKGDRCILLPADADCGKTTVTLALVLGGWSYLGDDVVLLRREADQVAALAWPDEFHVSPAAVRAFGLEQHVGPKLPSGRYPLDPQAAFPGAHTTRGVPTLILCPHITGTRRSRLSPKSRPSTLAAIVRQSPLVMVTQAHAADHLSVLRGLVAQLECYDLYLGRDALAGALPVLLNHVIG